MITTSQTTRAMGWVCSSVPAAPLKQQTLAQRRTTRRRRGLILLFKVALSFRGAAFGGAAFVGCPADLGERFPQCGEAFCHLLFYADSDANVAVAAGVGGAVAQQD